MFFTEPEPDRWVGLFVIAGVLLPMALWFLFEYLGPRVRAILGVLSAVMLLFAAVGALGRTSFLGYLVVTPSRFSPGEHEGREALAVVLMLLGLGLGLVVTVAARSREVADEVEAQEEPDALGAVDPGGVDDELDDLDDLDDLEVDDADDDLELDDDVDDELDGEDLAEWRVVDRRTLLPLPAGVGRVTFLVVALALALPVFGSYGLGGPSQALSRISGVEGFRAGAHLVDGLQAGLALLLPALVLRAKDTWLLVAGYAAVAFGNGLATMWPEVFANELWVVLAIGLAAGLLGPALLRLLTPELARDTTAVVAGIALAIGLLSVYTALESQASLESLESLESQKSQQSQRFDEG